VASEIFVDSLRFPFRVDSPTANFPSDCSLSQKPGTTPLQSAQRAFFNSTRTGTVDIRK
jgi:hypothetical protein